MIAGSVAGNYHIVRQLGEGGMGAVYLAEHAMLGRPAAVKVLLPELSQHRDMVARFFNEAKAATAIRHPGIVEIYDFGYLPGGSAYIVMELLDGENLAARLRRERVLPAAAALGVARQIAAALQAAHAKGIVHRDLKPDNIFIVPDPEIGERVKLLDFGIAKLVNEAPTGERTRTGAVMGTPTYMSPEQCRGAGAVDHRSDLYALGCIVHEMLAGRPPFVAEGAGDIIAHHLYFAPPALRTLNGGVSPDVEQLVLELLQKDPGARPQTAVDFLARLDRLRADRGGASMTAPTLALPAATAAVGPASVTTLSGSAGAASPASRGSRRRGWAVAGGAIAVLAVAGLVIAATSGSTATKGTKDDAVAAAPASANAAPVAPTPAASAPAPAATTPATPTPTPTPAATAPAASAPATPAAAAPAPATPATAALTSAVPAPAAPKPPPAAPAPARAPTTPTPTPAAAAPSTIVVKVASEPSGATVLVDGKIVGVTPMLAKLPRRAADHVFVFRKDGYTDERRPAPGSEDSSVTASLAKSARPRHVVKPTHTDDLDPYAN